MSECGKVVHGAQFCSGFEGGCAGLFRDLGVGGELLPGGQLLEIMVGGNPGDAFGLDFRDETGHFRSADRFDIDHGGVRECCTEQGGACGVVEIEGRSFGMPACGEQDGEGEEVLPEIPS